MIFVSLYSGLHKAENGVNSILMLKNISSLFLGFFSRELSLLNQGVELKINIARDRLFTVVAICLDLQ